MASTPAIESGLLSDYSLLRPSDQFASVLMYRDPGLAKGYRRILFRPVVVWRSVQPGSDAVPEEDLQYLADSLYRAMVGPLSDDFELVSEPGPGVLEIQLGLTLVVGEKLPVDFFSTIVPVPDVARRSGAMHEATRRFVQACALEAEFSESVASSSPKATSARRISAVTAIPRPVSTKRVVKAAFFDRRTASETPKGTASTWADVDAVFAKWAGFLDEQLVALRQGTFQPKLTTGNAEAPR